MSSNAVMDQLSSSTMAHGDDEYEIIVGGSEISKWLTISKCRKLNIILDWSKVSNICSLSCFRNKGC